MNYDNNYLPVNWVDGMKVTSADFNNLNYFIINSINESLATLTQSRFGLLPFFNESLQTNEILHIDRSKDQPVLHLLKCFAITKGGYRIAFNETIFKKLNIDEKHFPKVTLSDKNANFIVISTHPFKDSLQAGEAIEKGPPRRQFSLPLYKIDVIKEDSLQHIPKNMCVVGKLKKDIFDLDESYIPPCFSIYGHKNLTDAFFKHKTLINDLEITLNKSLMKALQKTSGNDFNSEVVILIDKLITYISQNKGSLNLIPIKLSTQEFISLLINLYYLWEASIKRVENRYPNNFNAGDDNTFKENISNLKTIITQDFHFHIFEILQSTEKFLIHLNTFIDNLNVDEESGFSAEVY